MQQLFSVAEKYEYWLASSDENAEIGSRSGSSTVNKVVDVARSVGCDFSWHAELRGMRSDQPDCQRWQQHGRRR